METFARFDVGVEFDVVERWFMAKAIAFALTLCRGWFVGRACSLSDAAFPMRRYPEARMALILLKL
jgi:hypothetical protein